MRSRTLEILSKLPSIILAKELPLAGLDRTLPYKYYDFEKIGPGIFKNPYHTKPIDGAPSEIEYNNYNNEYYDEYNKLDEIYDDQPEVVKPSKNYELKYGYLVDEYVFCKLYKHGGVDIVGNNFKISTCTDFMNKFITPLPTKIDKLPIFWNIKKGDTVFHPIYGILKVSEVLKNEFYIENSTFKWYSDYNGVLGGDTDREIFKDLAEYMEYIQKVISK